MRDAVAAASKDPDKAISWFDKVYKDKITMEDLADSEGMATLDAKLLSSPTNVVEGDLARRLDNIKERALMKGGSTRGRQALWLFHDHFSTHIHLGAVYALEDVMRSFRTGTQSWQASRSILTRTCSRPTST